MTDGETLRTRSIAVADLGRAAVAICVTLVALVNTIDINAAGLGAEKQVGLDATVAVKLLLAGVCGLIGLIGLATMPPARAMLLRGPGLVLVALGGVLIATSAVAVPEVATVSRIASLLVWVYLGFAAVALHTLGLATVVRCLLVGLVGNLIANWAVYLGSDSVGVFVEELGDGVEVLRMGGLGHPNAVARMGILASIIVVALARWRGDLASGFFRPTSIAVHGLTLATLYATVSRTAAAAGVLAIAVMMADWLWTRRGLAVTLAAAAAVLALVGMLSLWRSSDTAMAERSVIGSVTKTGDVSELTTATGRTAIWAESIRLIAARPATGYGLNSAPVMLEDFSYHTHNALLHAAFSGGLIAGGLMTLLWCWHLAFGITDRDAWVRGTTVFLLVSGMAEDTVLETFAGPATMVWFWVLLVPISRTTINRTIGGLGYTGPTQTGGVQAVDFRTENLRTSG